MVNLGICTLMTATDGSAGARRIGESDAVYRSGADGGSRVEIHWLGRPTGLRPRRVAVAVVVTAAIAVAWCLHPCTELLYAGAFLIIFNFGARTYAESRDAKVSSAQTLRETLGWRRSPALPLEGDQEGVLVESPSGRIGLATMHADLLAGSSADWKIPARYFLRRAWLLRGIVLATAFVAISHWTVLRAPTAMEREFAVFAEANHMTVHKDWTLLVSLAAIVLCSLTAYRGPSGYFRATRRTLLWSTASAFGWEQAWQDIQSLSVDEDNLKGDFCGFPPPKRWRSPRLEEPELVGRVLSGLRAAFTSERTVEPEAALGLGSEGNQVDVHKPTPPWGDGSPADEEESESESNHENRLPQAPRG
jgi:hypothetical protein